MDSASPVSRHSDDSIGARVGRRKRSAEEGPAAGLKDFFPAKKVTGLQDEKRAKNVSRKTAVLSVHVPQIPPAFATPLLYRSGLVPEPSPAFVLPTPERDPLGFFGRLPTSCLRQLCHSMSFGMLVTFAQLSREWSDLLLEYALSARCRARFISEALAFNSKQSRGVVFHDEDPFAEFGTFLKAVTICLPTKSRVSCFIQFMESIPSNLTLLDGWNTFIRAFTKKWAFNEIEKLFDRFLNMNNRSLRQKLNRVSTSVPGSNPALEMEMRYWLKLHFVNSSDGQRDSAFWLACILSTQPCIERKARILMIMFAPIVDEAIGWRSLVDDSVENWEDCVYRLKPLSDALAVLLHSRDCDKLRTTYKEAEVFQLIEEITTFPEPWAFDNFAVILAHRRPLLTLSLTGRCKNSMYAECGALVIRLKTLLRRWGVDAMAVLSRSLIGAMASLQSNQRKSLLDAIFNAFTSSYRENLLLADNGAAIEEEHADMVLMRPLLLELVNLAEQQR